MGETEISTVGSHVCRVQPVDLTPGYSPLQVFSKSGTRIAKSSTSQPPLVGKPNSDLAKTETYNADSLPPPNDDQEIVNLKSETCVANKLSPSQSVSPSPELITPPTSHSGSSRSYDCSECGKKFCKPSKLKNHLHLHSGERPFACKHPDCDKAYTNSSHLLRHVKSHQGNVAPLQICVECKAMFRSAGGLRKHMKTIHMTENEYPYPCNECGRAFRKKKLLMYHMHEHGGDPAFRCQHCDVQFTHKYLYNRHMRGHRTHPCRWPGCKLVLANWSLFRKHMALHNRGEYPVLPDESAATSATSDDTQAVQPIRVPGKKCPVCDMVIRSRNRYYTHLEQHKDVLKCPHPSCDRAYTYKRNLDNHIRTNHTEEARFVCDICGRSLASKQKLKMHKINMHVNGPKPHVPKNIARAPRKDKGKIKRALAAKLAGIEIPYEEEKRLLHEDEEFRKGDPLVTSKVVSSPESGFASLPGALRSNLSCNSDVAEEGDKTGEPSDASDLQGPSETQRRDDDHQETSTDEEMWYSGGESSDEESGSGHCEDDDGDDGEDHDDDGNDDDDNDNDEDDDFNEEDDEDEEGDGNDEEGEEERGDDNHLPQVESNNGKRPGPGSESLSRDEIQDDSGDIGVDRDSAMPSVESNDNAESPEELVTGDLDSNENDPLQTSKRKIEDEDCSSKRHCGQLEGADTTGRPNVAVAADCLLPDKKQLSRNVDTSIFEASV